MFKNKFKTKVVVVAAALVVVGGAAFAYWTTGGSGTGAADTGTSSNVTIVQTAFTPDALYPGGPAVGLSGTFTNPNSGPVYVAQVTVAITPAWSVGTGTPPCTPADFVLTAADRYQRRRARQRHIHLGRRHHPDDQRCGQPGQLQERPASVGLHQQLNKLNSS